MKGLKAYEINIAKLSNKRHDYNYELNNSFFELFSTNIVHGGKFLVHLILDKSERLISVTFNIKGNAVVTCDRSLEEFEYPIEIEENVLFKFGEEETELDENIIQITSNTQSINIAQHIYDFIVLALPMKKLHPRFLTDDYANTNEDILVYSSGEAESIDKNTDDSNDEEDNDPRWDVLKNLN